MSKHLKTADGKVTINTLRDMHNRSQKITMVTAYDFTMARLVDEAGIDVILVGDSLGNVVQGQATTLPVDLEHMIYHTECVARGVRRGMVMVDLPFMSYQISHEDAVASAGKLMKVGAESIKLEGGEEMADLVWYLNRIGIPVMAHVGLKPQCYHTMGGYKIQGKSKADADLIIADARAFEEAGAFALLLEGVPIEVAREITESVSIPTIGIGSGGFCSGQVLVCTDILGANPDFQPRFVRSYMDFHGEAVKAFGAFRDDVREGRFPSDKEAVHRNLVEVKPLAKPSKK